MVWALHFWHGLLHFLVKPSRIFTRACQQIPSLCGYQVQEAKSTRLAFYTRIKPLATGFIGIGPVCSSVFMWGPAPPALIAGKHASFFTYQQIKICRLAAAMSPLWISMVYLLSDKIVCYTWMIIKWLPLSIFVFPFTSLFHCRYFLNVNGNGSQPGWF